MKKLGQNILATTGLTLIVLALIASVYQAKYLFVSSVFQSFGANILIHIGIMAIKKFESSYFILETIVEVSYALSILLIFGFLFDWYTSTPLWLVILMGIGIYLISCFISIMHLQQEASTINKNIKHWKQEQNME